MNKAALFKSIVKAYSVSELPVAVLCGEDMEFNSAFKNKFRFIAESELNSFLEKLSHNKGMCHEMFDSCLYTVNVAVIEDITVIEIIRCESVKSLVDMPAVRQYLIYVFSKLRLSVNSISVAANDIYSVLSKNEAADSAVKQNLNTIDSSLLKIIGLIIDPEQIIYLTGDTDKDTTLPIKDELESITSDISAVFQKQCKVVCQRNDIVYSRVNRTALRTLMIDAASRFKIKGYIPDIITISSSIEKNDTAQIILEADWSSKRSYKEFCQKKGIEPDDNILQDFFFEYICSIFCKRYKGTFEQAELPDGYRFTLTFPSIKRVPLNVSAPNMFSQEPQHFDTASIRFAEFKSAETYI